MTDPVLKVSGLDQPETRAAPRLQVIHLASGNTHKAAELQRLADESPASRLLHLKIVPAEKMPDVAEDTGTFIGNARKKAQALQALLPPEAWVLADDSGVCVDELGGAPGVESAYFAGPQHDAAANLRKLTEVMRDVPDGQRAAHFQCVLVLRGPGERRRFSRAGATGCWHGSRREGRALATIRCSSRLALTAPTRSCLRPRKTKSATADARG